jgi:hypothetical protein
VDGAALTRNNDESIRKATLAVLKRARFCAVDAGDNFEQQADKYVLCNVTEHASWFFSLVKII